MIDLANVSKPGLEAMKAQIEAELMFRDAGIDGYQTELDEMEYSEAI